jgi:hypothetical protein
LFSSGYPQEKSLFTKNCSSMCPMFENEVFIKIKFVVVKFYPNRFDVSEAPVDSGIQSAQEMPQADKYCSVSENP